MNNTQNKPKVIAKYFVANGWKFGIPSTLKPGTWSYSLRSYKSKTAALRASKQSTGN